MRQVGVLSFALAFAVLTALSAHAEPQHFPAIHPDRVQNEYVRTDDQVDLKLQHLAEPGRPIVLLLHGLAAQGLSMAPTAQAIHASGQGYDVYVGDFRGAAPLPDGMTVYGTHNGLDEYIRYDLPAMLRYIRTHATPEQLQMGITLIGHSLGGVVINGLRSDLTRWAEFTPYVRGAVLFGSPANTGDASALSKWVATIASWPLKYLQMRGIPAFGFRSKLQALNREGHEIRGIKNRVLTALAKEAALLLANLAISPDHTGRDEFRRAFFLMPAETLLVDLLLQLRESALGDGQFRYRDGSLVIRPELLTDPTLFVRSRNDTLAPWDSQLAYYRATATRYKMLLSIQDMNHIDLILSTSFLHYIIAFIEAPMLVTAGSPREVYNPCKSMLEQVRLRLRVLKGI